VKRDVYLSFQMLSQRAPKERVILRWWRRRCTFLTAAADFTEISPIYRRKAVWVELAILMWIANIPIALKIGEHDDGGHGRHAAARGH
jgi:hypothetical protein